MSYQFVNGQFVQVPDTQMGLADMGYDLGYKATNNSGLTQQDVSMLNEMGMDTDLTKNTNQPTAMNTFSQGVGAVGGIVSLANMLNNWGVYKDAMKTNIKSVEQNMAQSREAFRRDKARQDRSRKAVAQANREAKALN